MFFIRLISVRQLACAGAISLGVMLSALAQPAMADTLEGEELQYAKYLQLDPIIVNVKTERRRGGYLKVTPALVTDDSDFLSLLENNVPLIRSTLLMLYSNRTVEQLLDGNAMESMRRKSLEKLRDLLRRQDGVESLNDVVFLEYVVQ